jgi:hypothetical protein
VKSPHCALTLEPEVGFQPTTFRLRVGCSALTWTAPDGSSLLRLDAPSVQMAPEGSRRIVWMIIGMIKAHPTKHRMPSHAGPERQGSERPRAAARAPRRPDRGWTWQEEPAMALAGGDCEIRIKGRLSDSLLAAFEGLTTTVQPVATVLHGPVPGPGGALPPAGPDPVAGPGAGRDPPATGISRRGSSRIRAPSARSVGWWSTSAQWS